jgi:hypothetical protein
MVRIQLTNVLEATRAEILRSIYIVKDNKNAVLNLEDILTDIQLYKGRVLAIIEDLKMAMDPVHFYQNKTAHQNSSLETIVEVFPVGATNDIGLAR